MRTLIDPDTMRKCEEKFFSSSDISSRQVMEQAARVIFAAVEEHYPQAQRIFIACGPGGNGGDGYACARLLSKAGKKCRIFAAEPARSPDAIYHWERALSAGIPFYGADMADHFPCPDVWIDCLYGTGLSRAPTGGAAALIQRMNRDRRHGAKLVAADIPSGLNGSTGKAFDPCVQADLCVALQLAKYGHYLQDGLDLCGEVMVRPVGFSSEAFPQGLPRLIEPGDLRDLFVPRRRNIYKGSCGHLLIVAGSVGMAGAAVLCAGAALRSGAGLVSVACPRSIVGIIQTLAPCALCIPLPERDGALSEEAAAPITAALAGKSAVVVGCGLSLKAAPEVLRPILTSGLPVVIDADALNLMARSPQLMALLERNHVLTPHPGEAARLLGRPSAHPVQDARALAQLGAVAVLKGASRVICDAQQCCISASGACGMARGGSGDVFAGLLGALLAEHSQRSTALSAAAACEIHGLAGQLAQEIRGPRGMHSQDLIDALPQVFQKYVD